MFIAFTIRTWSRRTVRLTAGQSMPAQSTVSWKDAPVEATASTVICFSFLVGWPNSLVRKDQTEVSPLSGRGHVA